MSIKEELLATFVASDGEFISGAALAEKLGVSRNAVWKAVKALETEGFVIDSVTAKGYRLSPENDRLAPELIKPFIRAEDMGAEVIVLSETDSTNNDAKRLASGGAAHGTVVIADTQTAGKGRLGRSFISPPGTGIYMSVIVRPELDISLAPMLTSAAACAVAEAVEELCGSEVRVKWVNDLYMNGRKICGILTEASMGLEMKSLEYAVIGIGINVRSVVFDEELSRRATSIEAETGKKISRIQLCAEIINKLSEYLQKIADRSFLAEYRRRELLTGNEITAAAGSETITGKAVGIDDNANLIVELESGEVRHLGTGEANLLRIVRT